MKTTVKVEFGAFKSGSKKKELPLVIKGELTDAQILTLTKLAESGAGFAILSSAQMDMEDYDDDQEYSNPRRGISYTVDSSGSAHIPQEKQLTIDDASTAEEDSAKSQSEERTGTEVDGERQEGEGDGVEPETRYEEELPGTGDEDDPMKGVGDEGKVADLDKARSKRDGKKKDEGAQPAEPAKEVGEHSVPDDDDALPF